MREKILLVEFRQFCICVVAYDGKYVEIVFVAYVSKLVGCIEA